MQKSNSILTNRWLKEGRSCWKRRKRCRGIILSILPAQCSEVREKQQTAIRDLNAPFQAEALEGQSFEVHQTAIRDIRTTTQVEVLEG